MQSAILHIGTEKTGTTSLQQFLQDNQKKLATLGLYVPTSLRSKNHYAIAISCYDHFRADDLCVRMGIQSEDEWMKFIAHHKAQLIDELSDVKNSRVIITSENIHSRLYSTTEFKRLQDYFQDVGCKITDVVVTLRDPASLASSHYSTDIGQGGVHEEPQAPDDFYFQNLCHHKNTIITWRNIFPEANFHVRLYDQCDGVKYSAISDFFSIFPEINISKCKQIKNQNVSISAHGLEIIRRINKIEPFIVDGKINPVRRGLIHHIRNHYSGKTYSLSDILTQRYDDYYAESNEWVRVNYFPEKTRLFAPLKKSGELIQWSDELLDSDAKKIVALLRRRHEIRCKRDKFFNFIKNIWK